MMPEMDPCSNILRLVRFGLLAVAFFGCGEERGTPAKLKVNMRHKISIPDSLGGRYARGEVVLGLRIVKGDLVVGFEPVEISVIEKPCESMRSYRGGSFPDSSMVRIEVLNRYNAWLAELFSQMDIRVHTDSSDWIASGSKGTPVDTLCWTYLVIVNEDIAARETRLLEKVDIPIADSNITVRGDSVSGTFRVRINIDRQGGVRCWRLSSLSAIVGGGGTAPKVRFDESHQGYDDLGKVRDFQPRIFEFVRSLRFVVAQDDPFFDNFDTFSCYVIGTIGKPLGDSSEHEGISYSTGLVTSPQNTSIVR
jgi:hypothetical protein